MSLDLSAGTRIYFIGIKGLAMSALAVICKQRGCVVAGSDVAEVFVTDAVLDQHDIKIFSGFAPEHLDWQPDVVIVGTSFTKSNVEVDEARRRGIPILLDAELRGQLSAEKSTIAVTGVHGKTTTTGWLAHVLQQAGLEPSYLVGTGAVSDLGGNAAWQSGKHFVIEGDEYSRSLIDPMPKFLDLDPAVTIITSIEWEHVDVYPNAEAIEAVFATLANKTKELVVACGDWASVQRAIAKTKATVVTYGLDPGNAYVASEVATNPNGMTFSVRHENEDLGTFTIRLAGNHNVMNGLAVIIAAHHCGVSFDAIRTHLASFRGTGRRFDVTERAGITFVDDYGHHPTEIKTTLEAARARFAGKRIICAFQPHMVSRTSALLDQFAGAFGAADAVYVVDIFASAREQAGGITSKDLATAIAAQHANVQHSGSIDQTIAMLQAIVQSGDVVVTMGAGDVYKIRDGLMQAEV
jgi:UDP-N-acetylmuramate--alanine ligase